MIRSIVRVSALRRRTALRRAATRGYRGDSGEMHHNLSESEEALLQVATPRSKAIFERHVRLPNLNDIPPGSFETTTRTEETSELELEVRRKRLVYRSKQRGWLEVDLLLGTWASQFVPTLNATELDEFEDFVNMETIDIYNIVTLRLDIPEELKTEGGNSVIERIQAWARDSPLGKADPDAYKTVKTDNNLI